MTTTACHNVNTYGLTSYLAMHDKLSSQSLLDYFLILFFPNKLPFLKVCMNSISSDNDLFVMNVVDIPQQGAVN
jgi:hypothetical protein